MGRITREHAYFPAGSIQANLTAVLATTPEIQMDEFVGGTIYIPTNSKITALAFYGAPYPSSLANDSINLPAPVFYQLFYGPTATSPNTAITMSVTAGDCYNLPPDIFGFGSIKMVATLSSGAVGNCELSLKG